MLLPETRTSPVVHVMGQLGAVDSACSQSGTELICSLGRVRQGQSRTIDIGISLAWSAEDLVFDADGSVSFEGLTTFPGSAWVAPYEVCLD